MRLAYSPEAIQDLIRLRQFIAEKNPIAASRVATELLGRIEQLLAFPEMGRPVAPLLQSDAVRDFVFGPYVVRYTLHTSAIVILRVWHHLEQQRGST